MNEKQKKIIFALVIYSNNVWSSKIENKIKGVSSLF